jgi:hypothetical protein
MLSKLQLAGSKPDRNKWNHRVTILCSGMRTGKHTKAVPGVAVDRDGRLVRGKGGVSISEIHGAVAQPLGTTPYHCTGKHNSRAMLQPKACSRYRRFCWQAIETGGNDWRGWGVLIRFLRAYGDVFHCIPAGTGLCEPRQKGDLELRKEKRRSGDVWSE